MYTYFDVEISHGVIARFRRNWLTRSLFVFRRNVVPEGNDWHGPGYGYGVWERI